jgi:putative intracellular protease/amidase
MKHLVTKANEAVLLTYDVLDIEITDRKDDEQAQVRSAVGVALSEYLKPADVAKALGKDRTMVYHYAKNHESNLKTWKGYADKYNVAKDVAKASMDEATRSYKVMLIDGRIREYQNRINELKLEKFSLI